MNTEKQTWTGLGSYGVGNGYQRLQLKLSVTSVYGSEEILIDSGKQPVTKEFPVLLIQNINESNRGCMVRKKKEREIKKKETENQRERSRKSDIKHFQFQIFLGFMGWTCIMGEWWLGKEGWIGIWIRREIRISSIK